MVSSRGVTRRIAVPLLIGIAAAIVVVVLLATRGSSPHLAPARPTPPTGPTIAVAPPEGLAIGITEANANLLWSPTGPPAAAPGFAPYRAALAALHPAYVRVLVDWAQLQPSANAPPDLAQPIDGCARGVPPCAVYDGLRAELAAIASEQRAQGGFQPLIVILGAPAWAAQPAAGCERPGALPLSRPIAPGAVGAYRALIADILALGRSVGLALPWWSPWNEPNHPYFISPQRAACDVHSPALAPAVYSELARAMSAELAADAPGDRMVMGELAGVDRSSTTSTSIAEFVADLPPDVICMGPVWSVHAYAGRAVGNPVGALEAALDARGSCGAAARIWVTETGAGAPDPGQPRPPGPADELAGCRAMARELLRWYRDPRVDVAMQYTFREDSLYPVGLATAGLTRLYPAYYLWLAWGGSRAPGAPPPALPAACTR